RMVGSSGRGCRSGVWRRSCSMLCPIRVSGSKQSYGWRRRRQQAPRARPPPPKGPNLPGTSVLRPGTPATTAGAASAGRSKQRPYTGCHVGALLAAPWYVLRMDYWWQGATGAPLAAPCLLYGETAANSGLLGRSRLVERRRRGSWRGGRLGHAVAVPGGERRGLHDLQRARPLAERGAQTVPLHQPERDVGQPEHRGQLQRHVHRGAGEVERLGRRRVGRRGRGRRRQRRRRRGGRRGSYGGGGVRSRYG